MRRRTLLQAAALAPLARPALAQPAKAATLRFIPQSNLSALDPIWTTATVTTNHAYYVYDTLYAADSNLRPHPQMAEGHEVSADGRTWRIKLREGLVFHDGEPVRARDCIASIQRWGKRDSMGQLLSTAVADWRAPDDRTIELVLSRPFPLLLDALAKPDASVPFIMPERLASMDAMKPITEVIGSGPYRFLKDEYVSGARVAYEKFDRYTPRAEPPSWASGGKVAHFARVEWNVIPDPGTAAAAMQRGEADWWERPFNDLLPVLLREPSLNSMIADPAGRLAVMRMNCLQAPFDNEKVRQVVRVAVNQEDYMRAAVGDDTKLWRTCHSLFPCGLPYDDDAAGAKLMPGNLDLAKKLLGESGYAGQTVVVINPTDYPVIGPLGQITADLLRKIGFKVDLQESDWGTVVQRRTSREPVDKGGWSIFHTTGSAAGWSNPAVAETVRGRGAKGWFGWWSSATQEQRVQEWLAAADEPTQVRIAKEIATAAVEDVGSIPLGQFFIRTVYNKRITGLLQGPCPYPWNVRPA
ncbi:MAG: ABC transporter substrate-binding protein [Rhodospirillales bacterium]|nr:ABC transporter substrate-binding protein [Rhodospirillales bacterium]